MGNDELDRLIDEALGAYGGNSRPGIERRVLNRIALAPVPARWPFARWTVAALAISGGMAVFIRPVPRPVEPKPRPEASIVEVVPAAPQVFARAAARTRRRKRSESREPLTDQERALLTLVERVPLQAEEILTMAEPAPVEPIAIAEITIPPLQ